MSIRAFSMVAGTALAAWLCTAPAHALTMQECSAKYKAAKSAGTLSGMTWNSFRKAECGADAEAQQARPTAPATTGVGRTRAAPSRSPSMAGDAVFPTAISPKYANQPAGKARMRTCLEQYRANKASGGNGSLKWIQKGGGYYSECNKRLSQQ